MQTNLLPIFAVVAGGTVLGGAWIHRSGVEKDTQARMQMKEKRMQMEEKMEEKRMQLKQKKFEATQKKDH